MTLVCPSGMVAKHFISLTPAHISHTLASPFLLQSHTDHPGLSEEHLSPSKPQQLLPSVLSHNSTMSLDPSSPPSATGLSDEAFSWKCTDTCVNAYFRSNDLGLWTIAGFVAQNPNIQDHQDLHAIFHKNITRILQFRDQKQTREITQFIGQLRDSATVQQFQASSEGILADLSSASAVNEGEKAFNTFLGAIARKSAQRIGTLTPSCAPLSLHLLLSVLRSLFIAW